MLSLNISLQWGATQASLLLHFTRYAATRIASAVLGQWFRRLTFAATGAVYRVVGLNPRVIPLHAGRVWERIVNQFFRLIGAEAQLFIRNALGRARPDWIWRKSIYDAKFGQYISFRQFKVFVEHVKNIRGGGKSVTYINLTRPSAALRRKLTTYAQGEGVAVRFLFFLP